MKERIERPRGTRRAHHVDQHLPQHVRAPAAPRGPAPGLQEHLHDPRRGRPAAAHQALPGGAQPRPQALPARGARRGRSATPRTSSSARTQFRERTGGHFAQASADVYELYEKRHAEMNAMDFDDLLMKTVQLLERFPDRLQHYQHAFRFVLIDEYQDTNHAQYRLANLLAEQHRNLAVVGDDDQSIYSWRGADIRNILEFERDYPDAKVIRLEQNYRSHAVHPGRRQRRGHPQPQAQGQEPVDAARRRARSSRSWRSTTSAPRRSSWPARCSSCWRGGRRRQGLPAGRDRRAVPHQRPEPRAGGAVRPLRHRLPGHRRPEVLRARGDPRCARLPQRAREPGRRAAAAARRQRAQARHRRHQPAAPAGARGDDGGERLAGDAGGGRRSPDSAPGRSAGCRTSCA